jgi:hypothetical protein
MKNKIRNVWVEILESKGKVSHKRAVTIIATLLLSITCGTVWFKGNTDQNLMLVYALIAFISALVGITAGADNRNKRIEKESQTKLDEPIN